MYELIFATIIVFFASTLQSATGFGFAISTTLGFFIYVYIIGIVIQLLTVKISQDVLLNSLMLIPAAAGVLLGNILFSRINQRMFQLIANGIILYTGFYMLYKVFF